MYDTCKVIIYDSTFSTRPASILYNTRGHHGLQSVFSSRATLQVKSKTHISDHVLDFQDRPRTINTSYDLWNIIVSLRDSTLHDARYIFFMLYEADLHASSLLIWFLSLPSTDLIPFLEAFVLPSPSSMLIPFVEVLVPSLPRESWFLPRECITVDRTDSLPQVLIPSLPSRESASRCSSHLCPQGSWFFLWGACVGSRFSLVSY